MLVPVRIFLLLVHFTTTWRIAAQEDNTETECGRSFIRRARIVGGELAVDGEFPWAVSLLFNGFHYCGGSVLARRWVLTAAHCLTNYGPNHFAVRVGFNSAANQISSQVLRVDRVVLHPRFSMPYLYDHDIALILLATSLNFGPSVQAVCLPESGEDIGSSVDEANLTDVLATAVGWGYVQDTSVPQKFSAGLRKVQVPIVEYKQCQEWYAEAGKVGLKLGPTQICAGYKGGGKDACLGDSGGPLTISVKGRQTILGVISAGIGCARPLLPGIYTRVSSYVDWLKDSMMQIPE